MVAWVFYNHRPPRPCWAHWTHACRLNQPCFAHRGASQQWRCFWGTL